MPFTQQLEQVIENVSPETLTAFFQAASDKFRPGRQDRNYDLSEDQDLLESLEQLGQIEFTNDDTLIVLAGKIIGDMTRRRSRSAQYAVARKIIKQHFNDAAIFVFYDDAGRFRFSLITAFYPGRRREFSTFKRYTYFVAPDQPNGTFLRQIGQCGFDTVDSILQAFSVEAVSKEFYTEIAKLFTDLVGGERKIGSKTYKGDSTLKFPNHDDTKRKEFAVRLIGRLVFCWFLKKKTSEAGVPLVPEEILSSAALAGTQRYYHNVLEPLFFETLNKEKTLRHKNFRDKYWDTIPFLNGGLFEAQPSDFYEFDDVTGLSAKYLNILDIPDRWLAHLLEVFDRYNFTIDESTPLDIEVAVDPEILGRIFENLLAEINPETGKTARKATGSYYTPRQIVEYMVHESAKQYLLSCTNVLEDKIDSLLSYDYSDNPLTDKQTEIVIDRLHKIKILDPACGSGAFPMGILHKIILALEKLDPDGARWKERILGEISDPTYRNALKDKLDNETWQYIHKLGVIRASIYGVDIQPIAIEIAKLRAFLSLVVDETVNDHRKNRGIEPLPNLEFKFVCANTLIDLGDTPGSGSKLFDTGPVEQYKQQLKTLRDDYFTCRQKDKPKIITDFTATQKQLLKYIIESGLCGKDGQKSELALKLTGWKPFENQSPDWFDPDWMFGVTDGFDIVIGNPPYGAKLSNEGKQVLDAKFFEFKSANKNSAIYFIYTTKGLLASAGCYSFIVPKSLCYSFGWGKCAEFIHPSLLKLIDMGKAFENVKLEQVILVAQREYYQEHYKNGLYVDGVIHEFADVSKDLFKKHQILLAGQAPEEFDLILKILDRCPVKFGDYVHIKRGLNWQAQVQKYPGKTPVHRGAQLSPYYIWPPCDFIALEKFEERDYRYQFRPKVLNQLAIAHVKNPHPHFLLQATLDLENRLVFETISCTFVKDKKLDIKFVLGLNNSKLFAWLLYKFIYSNAIRSTRYDEQYIARLPCPELTACESKPIIVLVDRILAAKQRNPEADTTALEREIDRMVYALYNLTENEIAIVEGK